MEKPKKLCGVSLMTDIYNRQQSLSLQIPESVSVIGVGGVGSWVALNLALVGTRRLILYDPDIIEDSNLNRTPFKITQIGQTKVSAVSELIKERRPDCTVIPYLKKIESKNELIEETEIIIDTRDTEPMEGTLATGGYDGEKITLHFNPNPKHIWGEGEVRYTITPSYLVPPQLIANLVTAFICSRDKIPNSDKEHIVNFSVTEFLTRLMKKERRDANEQKK